MSLTLNQIKKRLQTLAESHQQVNNFQFGLVDDLTDGTDLVYPVIVADLRTFNVSKTNKQTGLSFTFYFLDRVDQVVNAKENEYEVLSDQLSICLDYLAMLDSTTYQDDWQISKERPGEFKREYREDYLAGVSIDVVIYTYFLSDRCQVPSTDVTFEDPTEEDMKTVYKYTYTADGTEGSTLATSLIGKEILLHIREKFALDAVASSPLVDEFIYTNTSGVMTYGSDLNNGETIQILYRNI